MKNSVYEVSDEVRALIGQVTTGLLTAGSVVSPQRLIQALYQLSENVGDTDTRRDCLELIHQLMRKMH